MTKIYAFLDLTNLIIEQVLHCVVAIKRSHLIDVTEERDSSFSQEIPLGLRFIAISRLLTDEKYRALKEQKAAKS